jgi:hypothetical protein
MVRILAFGVTFLRVILMRLTLFAKSACMIIAILVVSHSAYGQVNNCTMQSVYAGSAIDLTEANFNRLNKCIENLTAKLDALHTDLIKRTNELVAENRRLNERVVVLETAVTLLKNSPTIRFGGIFVLQDGPVGSHDNALSGTRGCPAGFQENVASRIVLGKGENEGGALMVCVDARR